MRLALVAALLVLVACTGDQQAPPSLSRAATPSPAATPPSGPATQPPGSCSGEDEQAAVAAVEGQLAAFADDDFAAALGFASTGFREQFDEDTFRTLIETEFPVVRDYASVETGACLFEGDTVTLDVTVTDTGGDRAPLRYLLEREAGELRIGGAGPLQATV